MRFVENYIRRKGFENSKINTMPPNLSAADTALYSDNPGMWFNDKS